MTPRGRLLARLVAGQAPALAVSALLARAVGPERAGLRPSRPQGWVAAGASIAGLVVLTIGIRGTLARRPRSRRYIARELKAVEELNPATPLENALFVLVAVQAGFFEELVFRGLIPGLLLGGRARTAVSRALLPVFGLGHSYQGAYRVVSTAATGLVLAEIARAGRSVRPAIAAHVAIDLQLLWLTDHPLRPGCQSAGATS